MPARRVEHCRHCGRHESECGALSARHKCGSCGRQLLVENIRQMQAREGVNWERRLNGMRRYLLDASRVG